MLVPVLLSGGSGTRLWPVSRRTFPKQFINLVDPEKSLLQSSVLRIDGLQVEKSGWFVVGNEEHRFIIAEQLKQTKTAVEEIILEPCARNTAPAVAVAAIRALEKYPDAKLLIQTADHVVDDNGYFCRVIERAIESALPIVTFGVEPSRAETGYGYLEVSSLTAGIQEVKNFVEKPDEETARQYLASGRHLWNSGMFLLDANAYLSELKQYAPDIYDHCVQACERAFKDLDFVRLDKESFQACPSDSIDYAVMEKSQKVSVLPFNSGWSDLGAWDEVGRTMPEDSDGNSGSGNMVLHDSSNCFVWSKERTAALVGVEGLCVIDSPDALLVARKDQMQGVRDVVLSLRREGAACAEQHLKVERPWGNYETLAVGNRFQVKRITVAPNHSLSLQLHHHRAEHWVVVKGTAEVTNGDEIFLLTENQSTYIPVGRVHRLRNPGKEYLVLIEVQSGGYLEEDDIVRLEDDYMRAGEND